MEKTITIPRDEYAQLVYESAMWKCVVLARRPEYSIRLQSEAANREAFRHRIQELEKRLGLAPQNGVSKS